MKARGRKWRVGEGTGTWADLDPGLCLRLEASFPLVCLPTARFPFLFMVMVSELHDGRTMLVLTLLLVPRTGPAAPLVPGAMFSECLLSSLHHS